MLARELSPAGGRGTERSAGGAENPPRDCGALICGTRDCAPLFVGGRGTLRAICVICGELVRPTSELPMAGRCVLLLPGRGTPRKAGEGTVPDALSGPCGMIREGVRGEDPVRAADGPWAFVLTSRAPAPRLKLAGGVMREATGRIPLRAGGAAARWPAFGPSIAFRVGAIPTRPMGALARSLPETRIAVPRTGKPFCSVRDGAVVIPPGARRLA